ncbi:hypothetical protein FB451DRAFT_1522866 [Mycena latifolia]|nr:hypothetical protein FB451DRAFT_1522866 [Mycena latifolia]
MAQRVGGPVPSKTYLNVQHRACAAALQYERDAVAIRFRGTSCECGPEERSTERDVSPELAHNIYSEKFDAGYAGGTTGMRKCANSVIRSSVADAIIMPPVENLFLEEARNNGGSIIPYIVCSFNKSPNVIRAKLTHLGSSKRKLGCVWRFQERKEPEISRSSDAIFPTSTFFHRILLVQETHEASSSIPSQAVVSCVAASVLPESKFQWILNYKTFTLSRQASGGISLEITRLFLEQGARVTAHYNTNATSLNALTAEFGPGRVATTQANLSNEEDVVRMFAGAVTVAFGPVQVAIINHGVWPTADEPVATMSLDRWRATFDSNTTSSFLVAREFLRQLTTASDAAKAKASILFLGSTAGKYGEADHADYAASKSVNSVAPGWVNTPMAEEALKDPATVYRALATTALKKVTEPWDVATQVVVLSSPKLSGHQDHYETMAKIPAPWPSASLLELRPDDVRLGLRGLQSVIKLPSEDEDACITVHHDSLFHKSHREFEEYVDTVLAWLKKAQPLPQDLIQHWEDYRFMRWNSRASHNSGCLSVWFKSHHSSAFPGS